VIGAGREAGRRLEDLLARLDATLAELERSEDSEDAVERLTAMAELAREVQAEIERLRSEAGSGGNAPA
jgi:thioester reductase-like protein